MHLKGMEKFGSKLPAYSGRRIALLPLGALVSLTLGLVFLILVDVLARTLPEVETMTYLEPFLPILGQVTLLTAGFYTVSLIWRNRDRYGQERGELAFQRAFRFAVWGIPLVLASAVHSYVPIRSLLPGPPVNQITLMLSSPLLSGTTPWSEIVLVIRASGAIALVLLGAATGLRAMFTFGIDYMGLVYLYYPEESEVQQHEIYSIIRHPAYFGLLLLSLGGVFARLTIYSFVFFLLVGLGFLVHTRRIEDGELVQRFGQPFLDYRRRTPGLYIRRRDLRAYFSFLLGHERG